MFSDHRRRALNMIGVYTHFYEWDNVKFVIHFVIIVVLSKLNIIKIFNNRFRFR